LGFLQEYLAKTKSDKSIFIGLKGKHLYLLFISNLHLPKPIPERKFFSFNNSPSFP